MIKICDDIQLIQRVKLYNQIVCFGAGKKINRFFEIFRNTIVWEKTTCLIDNSEEKQGTETVIGEKRLKIISPSDLKRNLPENFAIIVTPLIYEDIVKQIDEDEILATVDCFCLSHILALRQERHIVNVRMPHNIRLSSQPLIPKRIHYCWFGGNPIPDKYKVWMESWHKYCPDYEIIQWNETNYDITKNTYMYQAYKNKKWAFVPDYARLDIIYRYGGIYLDTDVELLQNIDDLLYEKGFAGFEDNDYVALGLGFGAVKGLPIIRAMRDFYEELEFGIQESNNNPITSPIHQTKVLKKYGLNTNGEYQIVSDMTIYPIKVFNGKMVFKRNLADGYPKSVHHYEASSWQKESIKRAYAILDRDMEQHYQEERKEG